MWSNIKYTFNEVDKKIEETELGTYCQFPLRLAWAITVHKSQGLTFTRVNIDFTGGVFAAGQTYVALSRCTSLQGISLQHPIRREDVFVRAEVQHFAKTYNNSRQFNAIMQQANADVEYLQAVKAFDRGDMQEALDNFFKAIHSRYDIEKPVAKRYIRAKLNIINQQKKEIQRLREEIKQREKFMKQLAVEYTMMGRECEKEGMTEAARRNYEKALELCPTLPEAKRRIKKLTK